MIDDDDDDEEEGYFEPVTSPKSATSVDVNVVSALGWEEEGIHRYVACQLPLHKSKHCNANDFLRCSVRPNQGFLCRDLQDSAPASAAQCRDGDTGNYDRCAGRLR